MSGNLPRSEDEAPLLVKELAEIKEILRETSRQLQRIERRVKAAFPAAATMNPGRDRRPNLGKKTHLDEQSAQQVIAGLKERISKGEQIEVQLRDYSVKPDLQVIARILGMTNTKLPPKDELVKRISTRLRQSVSVTTGIHDETASFKNSNEQEP